MHGRNTENASSQRTGGLVTFKCKIQPVALQHSFIIIQSVGPDNLFMVAQSQHSYDWKAGKVFCSTSASSEAASAPDLATQYLFETSAVYTMRGKQPTILSSRNLPATALV